MTTVKAFDGTVHNFPDEAQPDQIQSVMQAYETSQRDQYYQSKPIPALSRFMAENPVGQTIAETAEGVRNSAGNMGVLLGRGLQQLGLSKEAVDDFQAANERRHQEMQSMYGRSSIAEGIGAALPYLLAPEMRVGLGATGGAVTQTLGRAAEVSANAGAQGAVAGASEAAGEGKDIGSGAGTGATMGGTLGAAGGAAGSMISRWMNSKLLNGVYQEIKDITATYMGHARDITSDLFSTASTQAVNRAMKIQSMNSMADAEINLIPKTGLQRLLAPIAKQAAAAGDAAGEKQVNGLIKTIDNDATFSNVSKAQQFIEQKGSSPFSVQASQVTQQYLDRLVQGRGSPALQATAREARSYPAGDNLPKTERQAMAIVQGPDPRASQSLMMQLTPSTQDGIRGRIMSQALDRATSNGTIDPGKLAAQFKNPSTAVWFSNPRDQAALTSLSNLLNQHTLESGLVAKPQIGGWGYWALASGALGAMGMHGGSTRELMAGLSLIAFRGALGHALSSQDGINFLAAHSNVLPGTPQASQFYTQLLDHYGGPLVAAIQQASHPSPVPRQ